MYNSRLPLFFIILSLTLAACTWTTPPASPGQVTDDYLAPTARVEDDGAGVSQPVATEEPYPAWDNPDTPEEPYPAWDIPVTPEEPDMDWNFPDEPDPAWDTPDPLPIATSNPYPPMVVPTSTQCPVPRPTLTPTATPGSIPDQLPTTAGPLDDRDTISIGSLSWDPSSRWLAYTTSDGRAWLRAINEHAATALPGIQAAAPATLDFAWSPDGDELLVYGYWGSRDSRWTAMWLVPVDESGAGKAREIIAPIQPESPVFQNEGVIYGASWAPDGERIAYSYRAEAWIYDNQNGIHEQVTQLVTEPLEDPFAPFDGVREVVFSPVGDYLGIGLTCNCPSPGMGVGVVDLVSRETRLIRVGALSGWSPDGEQIIVKEFGEWGPDVTFDVFGANPANGELINLTRSNPDFDPLADPWDNRTPAPYQTGGLRFLPDGKYIYSTYDYGPCVAFEIPGFTYPAVGFIIRQDPETILLEKRGTADAWYISKNILPDGRVGYIEVEPWHPEPVVNNENIFVMRRIVYGQESYEAAGLPITSAVWAPDGSALALVVESDPGEPGDENEIRILMLE